ncbi:hypothetical protein C2S53_017392 [Perilla frutescens var. hirtella]|uniref:Replication protein A 70 kDa DNA-binding subunit B/D first OB fold domain-containing protein n=1 Tax=Perilla frutescens var. hirtella TaxID=608512 RepID=A0AAD4P083_PERFH|nr:hypothetical protein C2S53_017392 [Perilla frutescens var. hirtella]
MAMWSVFNDLRPTHTSTAIKARLIRCYGVPSSNNRNELATFECIFHDVQGVRFQATVPRSSIHLFKDKFEEGLFYALKNFAVAHNTSKYRTTTHKYKATIMGGTHVRKESENENENFPKFIYSFKTFDEVLSMDNIADAVPFDVIGILKHRSEPREVTNGSKKRVMDMILEDTEGKRLCCSLWEEYIDECINQLNEQKEELNIIILQMCRPSVFQGMIKVSNAYHVTKIILNSDAPEVIEFKQRLLIDSSLSTSIISSTSQGTNSNINEELSTGVSSLKTMQELTDEVQTIGSTVRSVNRYDQAGNIKYKLIIHVGDDTGSSPFILWDREYMQVIGKTAAELNMDNSEVVDSHYMPKEILQALKGKKFLFKINVPVADNRMYKVSYSVSKLTADPNIVSTYATNNFDSQESDSISILESNIVMDKLDEDKLDEGAPKEGEDIANQSQTKATENTPIDSQSMVDVGIEWIDDGSLKRSLFDEFSATKPPKKPKVLNSAAKAGKPTKVSIKKEKD